MFDKICIIFILLYLAAPNTITASEKNLKTFQVNDAIEPYCDGRNPEFFLKDQKIKGLEIKINNRKKWYSNALKILVEFNSNDTKSENRDFFNFNINKKYKKKFKSKVKVNFINDNISCTFNAETRVTGDLWWHIDWYRGVPITSLQVKLLDGHINNITQFKLFLPKSREGGKNEIFVTSILKSFDFLAPKTFMLPTIINGKKLKYIFQEDLKKEFLENSKLVEGPILEGDERFTIDRLKKKKINVNFSLSRMANANYSLKNETKNLTSLKAVSKLNQIYLQHHQSENTGKKIFYPSDRLQVNTTKFFINKENKKKYQTYISLIYALDAHHGLSVDDIRLYYDPIKKYFIPIYYDGKSNILNKNQKLKENDLHHAVSLDAKKGAKQSLKLIKDLDVRKFHKNLLDNGLSIDLNTLITAIEKITIRLKAISLSEPSKIEFLKIEKYFSNLSKEEIQGEEIKLVFLNYKDKSFSICSLDLKICEIKKNLKEEYHTIVKNFIKQDFSILKNKNNKKTMFLYVYNNLDYEKIFLNENNKFDIINYKDSFNLKFNKEIKVQIIEETKKIFIKQKNNKGRILISGSKIDSWSIFFEGPKLANKQNIIPPDYLNLTGCLTFLDIEILNTNITSKNTNCEDSINLIRTSGNLNQLNIFNSKSDGLDMDFSNIQIKKINFSNIGNDCLDLSFGNYKIGDLEADGCGDKGVSIGEKTNAYFNNITIKRSNVAIAAKDSSYVEIESSEIIDSPICFSSYRKKQEFSGAIIKVKSTNCDRKKIKLQKGSSINLSL